MPAGREMKLLDTQTWRMNICPAVLQLSIIPCSQLGAPSHCTEALSQLDGNLACRWSLFTASSEPQTGNKCSNQMLCSPIKALGCCMWHRAAGGKERTCKIALGKAYAGGSTLERLCTDPLLKQSQ